MEDYSAARLIKETGISRAFIDKQVLLGKIRIKDGVIVREDAERIIWEKQNYIGLCEFAMLHDSDSFHGSVSRDRNRMQSLLEENDYYNLTVTTYEDLISGDKREKVYFLRSDLPVLEEKLTEFFWGYAMTEKDKVQYILTHDTKHPDTCKNMMEFMSLFMSETTITPAFTETVRILLHGPDLPKLKDTDISLMLSADSTVMAKDYLVEFLSYAKKKNKVRYSTVVRKKRESITIPAYSNETYLGLAKCFFNAEYIHEHDMIRKALDNHTDCEMWLYLTLFYTCGWRAEDVCRGWAYPDFIHNPHPDSINPDTLYEDILYDRLPDSVYEEVCDKAIRDIEVANRLPGKTSAHNPRPLTMIITPYLKPFYGLLTLISESHHLRTQEGYLKPGRAMSYQMNPRLKAFFGDEINEVLHGENIKSRRLNKDFLQGLDDEARKNGNGFLCSAVASYARNHVSLQSIRTYLKDHHMTGETAEFVLYCMMERGVFGMQYYQALLTAYPDLMKELPIQEQNKLIEVLKNAVTPIECEMNLSGGLAVHNMASVFINGNSEDAVSILHAMYEITQDHGKGKDAGIYCLRRARGEACDKPAYESCISACCDSLVFTRYGYKPLLSVLLHYKANADAGDIKAGAVLTNVLIPRYQKIINELMRSTKMPKEDRIGLRKMLEDTLNG